MEGHIAWAYFSGEEGRRGREGEFNVTPILNAA